ncbi:MAG TPA: glycine zipper domain-containing protein [Candidatus Paceibacterota bacterium]|nr:glycine zipper domain-containing protein [Candidatus Paceibacterota bacterium]
MKSLIVCGLTFVALSGVLFNLTGCSNLPGNKQQQGAVIGGLGGAAAGAAIGGKENRVLGALLGGALGAGGGYVIGANSDRILNRDTSGARTATKTAQSRPATAEEARNATTADLNNDGFVTLDEVVAMRQAGLSDPQMITRLQATGQVFELTPEQQEYLTNQGVSRNVVDQMGNLNRAQRDRLLNQPNGVISQPR